MNKYGNLFLLIYVILNVLFINIGSCLYRYNFFTLEECSKCLIILFVLNGIYIVSKFIYSKIKYKKIKFYFIDIILISIVFFSFISVIFAIDKRMAIYGAVGRYEGLFSILYYLSLFYLSTYVKPRYKKFVVGSILLGGIVESIYLMLQLSEFTSIFNIKIVRAYFNYIYLSPSGFISNPNFFGTYMIICLSYAIGLFMDNKYKIMGIDIVIIIIIFMAGLLMCNTLSALVGLIVVLLYLFIYAIKVKKIFKYIILIVILFLTTFTIHKLDKTTLVKDLMRTAHETKEIASGNVDDSYGSARMFIWKNTIRIIPKHFIHGAGIDNFRKAFDGGALINNNILYDKAHNELLQILITEGIFAFISYLLLYGNITFNGVKNSFINKKVYLILPIIGYLVQAFFNISVIEVAPLFFVSLGLCVDRENGKQIFSI